MLRHLWLEFKWAKFPRNFFSCLFYLRLDMLRSWTLLRSQARFCYAFPKRRAFYYTSALNRNKSHSVTDTDDKDRDLILDVMKSSPTQRELQQFVKRYLIPSAETHRTPAEHVDHLLTPDMKHITLTKIQGPLSQRDLSAVALTLRNLQKLGLMTVAVLDNEDWDYDTQGTEGGAQLRMRMMREAIGLVDAVEKIGGKARPIYGGIFMAGSEFGDSEVAVPPKPLAHGFEEDGDAGGVKPSGPVQVNFDQIESAMRLGDIAVVVPLVSAAGRQTPLVAGDGMVALSKAFAKASTSSVGSIDPVRVVVINNEGGIPNIEKPGTAHSLVNLQEEYSGIVRAYEQTPAWHGSHPTALQNLEMIRACLSELPSFSSAVIVPARSLPSALIHNLITDKPLYASSLPISGAQQIVQRVNTARTTIIRHGLTVREHASLETLHLPKLTSLLESSFGRTLDRETYYARLERVLLTAIVAGDYQGAAVVTSEPMPPMDPFAPPPSVPYLDKFAIHPSGQGTGLTDILWKRLADTFPELLWRSRHDNKVNKWYFERADGCWRVPETNWMLFWCGDSIGGKIKGYEEVVKVIPASFMKT